MPPVAIAAAVPGPTVDVGTNPAAISSAFRVKKRGDSSSEP